MKKVTKKAQREFLKNKLQNNETWAKRALIKIYEFQTDDEKATQSTHVYNNVGFSGAHAEILSSFAEQLEKYGRLSSKQMTILFRIIPKYWRQVLEISDVEKVNQMILEQQYQEVKQGQLFN